MTKKEKEKTIANYMQTLQLSREEAEELLLFDNDEIDNEEASILEEKAEKAKKEKKVDKLAKVKTLKASRKQDLNKEKIINKVADLINNDTETFINPQPIKKNKYVFTDADGYFYSITVTKHKTQPTGYEI